MAAKFHEEFQFYGVKQQNLVACSGYNSFIDVTMGGVTPKIFSKLQES